MKDIKKRFIDILFESDDEDEEEVVPVAEPVKKKEAVKKEETSFNAKDVLYRKSDQSAFINLEETIKTVKENKAAKEEEYELSSQISPIFGLIKENKPTYKKPADTGRDETLLSKPDDSHLEIITSPIYGYGTKDDQDISSLVIDNGYAEDEEELHRLLDVDPQASDYVRLSNPEKEEFIYPEESRNREEDEDITLFDIFGDKD